ncbi:MAG: zeta toxin family protein [Candidatus Omnitrophica bacterium]|nr:zeta toxin family protein [Candidatus Omnitrophota bacterium]
MKKTKSRSSVYIIAGPNGAGKTTFAIHFLPVYANCNYFVNADLIAKGVSPFAPQREIIKAGRILLEQIHSLSEQNVDFAFETTLSGRTYIRFIENLKRNNYTVYLYFLWIPNVQLSIARVKERVRTGGHNIPIKDIRRRFSKSIHNFFTYYKNLVDYWALIDNSEMNPDLIAHGTAGKIEIINNMLFKEINKKRGEKDVC